jgi:hypothetical protein
MLHHDRMAVMRDQIKFQVTKALKAGYSFRGPETCVEVQSEEVMQLIARIAEADDLYHMLVDYLNTIRLHAQEVESRHGESTTET